MVELCISLVGQPILAAAAFQAAPAEKPAAGKIACPTKQHSRNQL